jgi:long-chain acyl-CoA synthetase
VVPNFDSLRPELESLGVSAAGTPQELVQNPKVHEFFRNRITERTRDLAHYEKIKYFTLLARELSQKDGEVTLTLKIKRNIVSEHDREVIDRMYLETQDFGNERRERIFFVL